MKIFAVNGSPRKKGNTATVLEHFLEGARSAGADTEVPGSCDFPYRTEL